ncbi:hypothetical protein [Paraburkholderia hospita]|jgi:hypothetical protein|uniref:hypothetical protein n=1 Tax=Paraburkholderia hospita TaxID=169430 RepID=UPI001A98A571|nr:hypothetical protein [Paraburkholderia hospita]
MRDVPHIEASSYIRTEQRLRFLARDARNPWAALVYWLGATEPSRESSFFDAMQKFGTLMQLVLPDERPGVFVKRDAVQSVMDFGTVKRLVFKDGSALDVRYAGPPGDLYDEATSNRTTMSASSSGASPPQSRARAADGLALNVTSRECC